MNKPRFILVHCRKYSVPVNVSDIVRVEVCNDSIAICLTNGEQQTESRTLKSWLNELNSLDFFCPHRSYAVNGYHIKTIKWTEGYILMTDESRVPIAFGKRRELRIWFNRLFTC